MKPTKSPGVILPMVCSGLLGFGQLLAAFDGNGHVTHPGFAMTGLALGMLAITGLITYVSEE